MDSIQMESQSEFKSFIGKNYYTALDQSLQTLLDSAPNWNFEKLSSLTSTFSELLQCKINQPLETVWVYSALAFRELNSSKNEPLNHFAALKDLFQLIVSRSAPCNSVVSILMMSPVIYHVHKFVVDLKGFVLRSKKEKKLMKDIRDLVDSVIGFVSVFSEGLENNADSLEGLIRPLEDLISIWISDEKEQKEGDRLKFFFPLLGDEIVGKMIGGSCGLSELAGCVIAQVFLLRYCLAFPDGSSPKDSLNELRDGVVGSITGLRSSYFFDALLRLLLGPSLPVASLLSSDDEIRFRKVLYDAVILVEYSFLNPERMVHLPFKHVKSTALGRLIVVHEAVEFFRKQGEQSKALSCLNAFSASRLQSQIIRCVKSQIGIRGDANEPNEVSPKALLRWILNIENRGMQVFDNDMGTYRAKMVLDHSEDNSKLGAYKEKNSDTDLLFYIDNKGEDKDEGETDEKMAEAVSASFVTAAHSLQSADRGGKKRKSGKVEKKGRLKFRKYKLYEDSDLLGEKSTFVDTNNLNSTSDVENPSSDEDD
ncbi:OLC1v1037659C2 [Oldenlandia corymbosa var. corymbosa]|uniref:OLC1v1037659C2 n=1 Tax=Oldenlandia corymbosa var. corymbosa TaxID=529605 RepID=A0AAV1CYL7_OLDCO|nr:OLC1v1037659C2 [Oldenlandia corymbosa var. corymbosa]